MTILLPDLHPHGPGIITLNPANNAKLYHLLMQSCVCWTHIYKRPEIGCNNSVIRRTLQTLWIPRKRKMSPCWIRQECESATSKGVSMNRPNAFIWCLPSTTLIRWTIQHTLCEGYSQKALQLYTTTLYAGVSLIREPPTVLKTN